MFPTQYIMNKRISASGYSSYRVYTWIYMVSTSLKGRFSVMHFIIIFRYLKNIKIRWPGGDWLIIPDFLYELKVRLPLWKWAFNIPGKPSREICCKVHKKSAKKPHWPVKNISSGNYLIKSSQRIAKKTLMVTARLYIAYKSKFVGKGLALFSSIMFEGLSQIWIIENLLHERCGPYWYLDRKKSIIAFGKPFFWNIGNFKQKFIFFVNISR